MTGRTLSGPSAAADVSISLNENGVHVIGRLRGTDVETVQALGKAILDNLSAGKKTLVRAEPTASEERDAESGEVHITGFVRFTVLPEDGEAETVDPNAAEIVPFRSQAALAGATGA